VFSNRNGDEVRNSLTIILLDSRNTAFDGWKQVKQVITFLEQMRPGDRVALYAPGREVHVLHDFPTSQERLLLAAAQYRGASAD
jgi:hypothetical protein